LLCLVPLCYAAMFCAAEDNCVPPLSSLYLYDLPCWSYLLTLPFSGPNICLTCGSSNSSNFVCPHEGGSCRAGSRQAGGLCQVSVRPEGQGFKQVRAEQYRCEQSTKQSREKSSGICTEAGSEVAIEVASSHCPAQQVERGSAELRSCTQTCMVTVFLLLSGDVPGVLEQHGEIFVCPAPSGIPRVDHRQDHGSTEVCCDDGGRAPARAVAEHQESNAVGQQRSQ
jgi:hypothetical protein